MKTTRGLVILLVCLTTLLSSCSELAVGAIRECWDYREGFGEELNDIKDAFLSELCEVFAAMSEFSLTEDSKLQGIRAWGANCYVGEYNARYDSFSGKEFLFGGTALQSDNGEKLKLRYSLEIESGSAELLVLQSGDDHIMTGERKKALIASVTQSGMYEVTLTDGGNFIAIEGEDFSGSLSIASER